MNCIMMNGIDIPLPSPPTPTIGDVLTARIYTAEPYSGRHVRQRHNQAIVFYSPPSSHLICNEIQLMVITCNNHMGINYHIFFFCVLAKVLCYKA